MDETPHCPDCGGPLAEEGWSEELCPRCLMRLALVESSDPELEAGVDATPLTQNLPSQALSSGQILGKRYGIRTLLGRGGMGAVLGAKNVKGLAFAGTLKCEIADDELLKSLVKKVAKYGKDSPVTEIYQNFGTPNQIKVTNAHQCFPTYYWKAGYFDKWENVTAAYMQENFQVVGKGCPTCFLRCQKKSTVKHGRHANCIRGRRRKKVRT